MRIHVLRALLPVLLLQNQLAEQGILQISVSLKTQLAAQSYNGGSGTVGVFRELMNVMPHGLVRVGEDIM